MFQFVKIQNKFSSYFPDSNMFYKFIKKFAADGCQNKIIN